MERLPLLWLVLYALVPSVGSEDKGMGTSSLSPSGGFHPG
jgi:hypothetical protein